MRKILSYIIPTVLALTLNGFYTIIDGLFIGQKTGDIGLAAVNIAWPIPALFIALGLGIGVGGSILYSQQMGENNHKNAKRVLKITFIMLLITSLIMFLIFNFSFSKLLILLGAKGDVYLSAYEYLQVFVYCCFFPIIASACLPILRNIGFPLFAMIISIMGLLFNLLLNYTFVIYLELGVKGAALGTVISQGLLCLMTFIFIFSKRKKLNKLFINNTSSLANKEIIVSIIKKSLTPFGLSLAPSIVLIFSNYACLNYGSTVAVASYTVISYVTFPISNMLLGIGDGLQPLISYYYGSKRINDLNYVLKIGKTFVISLGIIVGIVTFVFSNYIGEVFKISNEALVLYNEGIKIACLAFVFIGLNKFEVSYRNACGDSNFASGVIYLESLLVAPFMILTLSYLFNVDGIWYSYLFTAISMSIVILVIKKNRLKN